MSEGCVVMLDMSRIESKGLSWGEPYLPSRIMTDWNIDNRHATSAYSMVRARQASGQTGPGEQGQGGAAAGTSLSVAAEALIILFLPVHSFLLCVEYIDAASLVDISWQS